MPDAERSPTAPAGATCDERLDETPSDQEPLPDAAEPMSLPGPSADPRRYRVIREVASGGLGRIFEVEDTTLRRKVAVKELRVSGGRSQARFLREAMITARLQHPSIVPLYDLGRWGSGEPYYAMKLVSGRAFDAVIAAAASLDARLALIPHVIAVADAIAYAHSQRIIHRDLKPANILIGEFGETVVIDWGLAKDLDEPDEETSESAGAFRTGELPWALTAVGEVVGTPVYMAPEQAMQKTLDERADVYALGGILYELLSGTWPHHGANVSQVIARLIAGNTVTPIDVEQSDVPPELATIVHKAMAHDRDARYRSAAELATDLRRFQTGQIVAAHRYSRRTLLRRWVRRHRAPVAVGAILIAVLAATVAMGVRRIVAERDATGAERDRLILVHARGELERDPTAAVAWLKTYPVDGAEPDQAREIAMEARAAGVASDVLPRDRGAGMGRFSPDGKLFAQPDRTRLRLIELATGKELSVGPGAVNAVAWSPDSARLLVKAPSPSHAGSIAGVDGRRSVPLVGRLATWRSTDVDVFGADGATIVLTLDHSLMRYGPDGGDGRPIWVPFPIVGYTSKRERIASLSKAGVMWWWVASETAGHALETPPGVTLTTEEMAYALVGDGTRLAAGTSDGRLCVWSLLDGSARVLPGGDGSPIAQLAVSRDGNTVVSVAVNDSLRRWQLDVQTSEALPGLGEVHDIGMSASGRWLVVAHDREVFLVDVQTGDHRRIGRHPATLRRVGLSPDGRWIASDGEDGTTRLWRLPDEEISVYGGHIREITALAFSPDGATLAAAGDNLVSLWSTTGLDRRALAGHGDVVSHVMFAGDGKTLVTASADQTLRLWDVATAQATGAMLDAGAGGVTSTAVSRDGRRVVVAYQRGEIRTWDLQTGHSRLLGSRRDRALVALSPDGRLVAVADLAGGVGLLAVEGEVPRIDAHSSSMLALQFSPDGRRLAAGGRSGEVAIWDLATGVGRALQPRRGAVHAIAFSSDGRWLAAGSTEGDVGLWDLTTAQALTLAHTAAVVTLVFAPDATGLVTGGADGSVRLWGLPAGDQRSVLRLPGQVTVVDVDRAGRQLAAGSNTGVVYRWPFNAFGSSSMGSALGPLLDELTRARLDSVTSRIAVRYYLRGRPRAARSTVDAQSLFGHVNVLPQLVLKPALLVVPQFSSALVQNCVLQAPPPVATPPAATPRS